MEIKINTLTLHNFKGALGTREFSLGGTNARIEGDNGTGKSTVFDAFTWLLFGKDHLGQDWTNFDIKPLDPVTGAPVPDLDSFWVEAALLVDGTRRTLRRVVTEDWVKPKGESVRVLKGNVQTFFLDGVACPTKKAYDLAIHEWIDEVVFRTITNPLCFIDDAFTPWQERRKTLLSIAGYDPDAVAAREFPDLVEAMNGEELDMFRRRIAAEKKVNKDSLAKANANIGAWRAALPADGEKTEADVKTELLAVKATYADRETKIRILIDKADAGIADINTANRTQDEAIAAKRAEIRALNQKVDKYLADAVKARQDENKAREDAIAAAHRKVADAEERIRTLEDALRRSDKRMEELQLGSKEEKARLTRLSAEYEQERATAFAPQVDDVCPVCGRPFSEEEKAGKRDAIVASLREEQRRKQHAIQERVPAIRAEIAVWDESIKAEAERKAETEHELLEAKHELTILDHELEVAEALPVNDIEAATNEARRTMAFHDLELNLEHLEADVNELQDKRVSADELLADRRRYEGEIAHLQDECKAICRPLEDALAVFGERRRIQGLIDAEERRRAAFSDEVARLERLEARVLEFIKASVSACNDAISALFHDARWKMFSYTLDGGIVEMCEVTTKDGVPYRSMNAAARILCGIDCIRVLCDAYGVSAPIFIDNAEGVTRTAFDTASQVIRLVVKEGAPLAVINE